MPRGQLGDSFEKKSLDQAQKDAQRANSKLEYVSDDIERLLMISEALWLLLKKEHGYADNVLTDMIKEIDLRDGRLGGCVPKAPGQLCPHCGKPTSNKQLRCIYCDQPVTPDPFAR
jgi:hypothetical protein